MPKRPGESKIGPVWTGLGLSLIAGGALIGATFLGDAPASARGGAGTYALNTLPDNYGATDLLTRDRKGGVRQAYHCYYYSSYYECCYYYSGSSYYECCYYYGYNYCYYYSSSRSGENINEGNGFAALRPAKTATKKPVNAGGFTAVEKGTDAGSQALDNGGFTGAGRPAEPAGYNNTFL
jgi:hypothetical protein